MQELIEKYGGEKHLVIPEDLRQTIDPADLDVLNEV